MNSLTKATTQQLVAEHGSPLYVYDIDYLRKNAQRLKELADSSEVLVRYAVKANPHPEIIKLFYSLGIHFDASSSYEAEILLRQNIPGEFISVSSQQPPHNLKTLIKNNVQFVATSLHQLHCFIAEAPVGSKVGLRINPGVGSGHNNRTTTGGVAASFGLWHEYIEDTLATARKNNVIVDRLHTHIGSGADSQVWRQSIQTSLDLVRQMPDVERLDIGGGYKVKRWENEQEADMQQILEVFADELQIFYEQTGRRITLEIEPGTWLVAHAGSLITTVVDIVDTGKNGYAFLRTDTGLNDFMRPAMYGSQHKIEVLNDSTAMEHYVVVGHNCESGDILTPEQGNPEQIKPRLLKRTKIGDLIAVKDVGAYGASMRAQNYNAFPSAKEIIL